MDIQCMEPIRIPYVVDDPEFIHQIKWDGVRGITHIENNRIRVYTKKGYDCTESYPELTDLLSRIDAGQAVLDGELVVMDNGKPSFYRALQRNRMKNRRRIQQIMTQYPVTYVVFDLLFIKGKDIRNRPLAERQEMLKSCFKPDKRVVLVDDFDDGAVLFALMKQKNMEGIVSKRKDSLYVPGKKHGDWYKTKLVKKMLCVITGVNIKDTLPKSVALGIYRDGNLVNIGNVSSGLSQSDLKVLAGYLQRKDFRQQWAPIWPMLTCWVQFSEWTQNNTLRHPVLLGFSDRDVKTATGEEMADEN